MKVIVISKRHDERGWYWSLRVTENGQVALQRDARFRKREAAIAAAREQGGQIKFWNS